MNTHKKPSSPTQVTSHPQPFTRTKDYLMLGLGIISVIYLLNFTFGFIEFLPDSLPVVGNLDEAVMVGVFISVLQYFNIDITGWFKRS